MQNIAEISDPNHAKIRIAISNSEITASRKRIVAYHIYNPGRKHHN